MKIGLCQCCGGIGTNTCTVCGANVCIKCILPGGGCKLCHGKKKI